MKNFLEITSNDNWFKLHPEKIAGVEYETTSFYFPIMVKGTKEDVLRVTGINNVVRVPTGTDKEKRMRLAKAKAKAVKIKLLLMETEVKIKKHKVGQIVFSEKHQQFFKIKKLSRSANNKNEFVYDVSSIEKDKKAINMPYETFEGFDYFNDATKKYVTKFQDLEKKRDSLQATYDVVEKNLKSEQDRDYSYKELSKYDAPITAITKEIELTAERFSKENKISINHSWGIALIFTTILKNK